MFLIRILEQIENFAKGLCIFRRSGGHRCETRTIIAELAWFEADGGDALMAISRTLPIFIVLTAASGGAAVHGGVTPAQAAAGDAPWCAVIDYGDGGVSWQCDYRSFEECYPNVIAGNKGFCEVNPYGPGSAAAKGAPAHQRRTHRPYHRLHRASPR